MADTYSISCKSEEQRGATQPNILSLAFGSSDDALAFVTNLNLLLAGEVVTVDSIVPGTDNYALPYPAGTNLQARLACFTSEQRQFQMRIRDLHPSADLQALVASLIGVPLLNPYSADGETVSAINATVIQPGQTVIVE